MAAIKKEFPIEKGATFKEIFIWKDSAGNPKDLTGYTGKMHIRSSVDSDEILVDMTTENSRIELSGTPGQILLRIEATITKDFQWSDAVYDLFLTSPSGEVEKLFFGAVKAIDAVTR
jgi:hypothetical protein